MVANIKMTAVTTIMLFAAVVYAPISPAGLLDSNCTAKKAATSAVAKATVGVGGRCTPAKAAKDTLKNKAPTKDTTKKEK